MRLIGEDPEIPFLDGRHWVGAGSDSGKCAGEDFDCEIEVVFAFGHCRHYFVARVVFNATLIENMRKRKNDNFDDALTKS